MPVELDTLEFIRIVRKLQNSGEKQYKVPPPMQLCE